jgi:hypothetical protein
MGFPSGFALAPGLSSILEGRFSVVHVSRRHGNESSIIWETLASESHIYVNASNVVFVGSFKQD